MPVFSEIATALPDVNHALLIEVSENKEIFSLPDDFLNLSESDLNRAISVIKILISNSGLSQIKNTHHPLGRAFREFRDKFVGRVYEQPLSFYANLAKYLFTLVVSLQQVDEASRERVYQERIGAYLLVCPAGLHNGLSDSYDQVVFNAKVPGINRLKVTLLSYRRNLVRAIAAEYIGLFNIAEGMQTHVDLWFRLIAESHFWQINSTKTDITDVFLSLVQPSVAADKRMVEQWFEYRFISRYRAIVENNLMLFISNALIGLRKTSPAIPDLIELLHVMVDYGLLKLAEGESALKESDYVKITDDTFEMTLDLSKVSTDFKEPITLPLSEEQAANLEAFFKKVLFARVNEVFKAYRSAGTDAAGNPVLGDALVIDEATLAGKTIVDLLSDTERLRAIIANPRLFKKLKPLGSDQEAWLQLADYPGVLLAYVAEKEERMPAEVFLKLPVMTISLILTMSLTKVINITTLDQLKVFLFSEDFISLVERLTDSVLDKFYKVLINNYFVVEDVAACSQLVFEMLIQQQLNAVSVYKQICFVKNLPQALILELLNEDSLETILAKPVSISDKEVKASILILLAYRDDFDELFFAEEQLSLREMLVKEPYVKLFLDVLLDEDNGYLLLCYLLKDRERVGWLFSNEEALNDLQTLLSSSPYIERFAEALLTEVSVNSQKAPLIVFLFNFIPGYSWFFAEKQKALRSVLLTGDFFECFANCVFDMYFFLKTLLTSSDAKTWLLTEGEVNPLTRMLSHPDKATREVRRGRLVEVLEDIELLNDLLFCESGRTWFLAEQQAWLRLALPDEFFNYLTVTYVSQQCCLLFYIFADEGLSQWLFGRFPQKLKDLFTKPDMMEKLFENIHAAVDFDKALNGNQIALGLTTVIRASQSAELAGCSLFYLCLATEAGSNWFYSDDEVQVQLREYLIAHHIADVYQALFAKNADGDPVINRLFDYFNPNDLCNFAKFLLTIDYSTGNSLLAQIISQQPDWLLQEESKGLLDKLTDEENLECFIKCITMQFFYMDGGDWFFSDEHAALRDFLMTKDKKVLASILTYMPAKNGLELDLESFLPDDSDEKVDIEDDIEDDIEVDEALLESSPQEKNKLCHNNVLTSILANPTGINWLFAPAQAELLVVLSSETLFGALIAAIVIPFNGVSGLELLLAHEAAKSWLLSDGLESLRMRLNNPLYDSFSAVQQLRRLVRPARVHPRDEEEVEVESTENKRARKEDGKEMDVVAGAGAGAGAGFFDRGGVMEVDDESAEVSTEVKDAAMDCMY